MYKSIPKSSPIDHSFPTIFRQPNRFSNESKKFNRTQIAAQVNGQGFELENLPIENTNKKIIKIKIKKKIKIFKQKISTKPIQYKLIYFPMISRQPNRF